MKNFIVLFFIASCLIAVTCSKEKKSERFKLLTTPVWACDSLLANGAVVEASGPYNYLLKFTGDAKFKENGTGNFGNYTGQWRFNEDETAITIITDSLPLPLYCPIIELTVQSLKITTNVPDRANPQISIFIRMTFKSK
jgi:hypothetical protein